MRKNYRTGALLLAGMLALGGCGAGGTLSSQAAPSGDVVLSDAAASGAASGADSAGSAAGADSTQAEPASAEGSAEAASGADSAAADSNAADSSSKSDVNVIQPQEITPIPAAESTDPQAETNPENPEGTPEEPQRPAWEGTNIIYNAEGGYRIEFPEAWAGRYTIDDTGRTMEVYCSSAQIPGYSGYLFSINRGTGETMREQGNDVRDLPLMADGTQYYGLVPKVKTYPDSESIAADYQDMAKDVTDILSTFVDPVTLIVPHVPGIGENGENTYVIMDPTNFTGAEYPQEDNYEDGSYQYLTVLPQGDGTATYLRNQSIALPDYDSSDPNAGYMLAEATVYTIKERTISSLEISGSTAYTGQFGCPAYLVTWTTSIDDVPCIGRAVVVEPGTPYVFMYSVEAPEDGYDISFAESIFSLLTLVDTAADAEETP